MTELLKTLCALPGPSGCEDAVRAFVLKKGKAARGRAADGCDR